MRSYVIQSVKKMPASHETKIYIIVFVRAYHLTLTSARQIWLISSNPNTFNILSNMLRTPTNAIPICSHRFRLFSKIVCAFTISSNCATYPIHFIHLDFITVITSGVKKKTWSSTLGLSNLLYAPVISRFTSKHSYQHLKFPQTILFIKCDIKFHTYTKQCL